jgi:DnaJ domain
MNHYYRILELNEGSTVEEIKRAYRRLVKVYHPDVNKSPNAHEKFIEISEAYEILMHEVTFAKTKPGDTEEFNYEEFLREVREAANRQARMRYEKFQREHEAFRESGLYDLALLFKYIGRVLEPLIAFGLISIPVIDALHTKTYSPLVDLCFFWIIGLILLFDTYQRRKNYFRLGGFYYSFKKILNIYTGTNNRTGVECFYCNGIKANSKPYKLTLIRVKGVQLDNRGPLQHYVRYDSKEYIIDLPRSQKAFIIHSVTSIIKIITILTSLFFLPLHSILWRFIVGTLLCWLFSSSLLWITHTRSKTGYFLSYAILVKTLFWFVAIILASKFDFVNFDVITSKYVSSVIVFMFLFDSIVEQLLNVSKKIHLFKPLSRHYQPLSIYFEKNCRFYLEIPVWTVVYPFIRWVL